MANVNALDGSVAKEVKGEDMKLGATEGGYYTDKFDADHDDDGRSPRRSGTWITGTAHIITAVIGSGVLSLGWSIAQMGWAFGPLVLLMFAAITWYCSALLCDCYRVDDEYNGRRVYNYMSAVKAYLGPVNQFFCAFTQHFNLVSIGVGYTVTGSLALVATHRATCFHKHGNALDAPCTFSNNPWIFFFGALQILLSQVPDFHGLWWLSYLATAMSLAYSTIGLGLSIGKATESGHDDYGTAWGVAGESSPASATWNIFVGLGSVAFAYSFSNILIEIEDTLAKPTQSSERKVMRKATRAAIIVTTFYYMSVGCISYAGFGNAAPGNLLTGFGFFNPYWLVGAANVFVFVHLLGGYQVYMMPFMIFIEWCIRSALPNVRIVHWEWETRIPIFGRIIFSPLKLVSRTLIVCATTVLALLLPFFNDLVGFIGSVGFWPLTVYFPVEMHISAKKVPRWGRKWCLLQLLSLFTLCISLASAIGSIEYVILDVQSFTPFHSVSGTVSATGSK